MSIPAGLPGVKFSGFYEVYSNESKLDDLPLGRAFGLPYQYSASRSAHGVLWINSRKQDDDRFEAAFKEAGVRVEKFPADEVVRDFAGSQKPDLNNLDDPALNKTFMAWARNRLAKLFQQAFTL